MAGKVFRKLLVTGATRGIGAAITRRLLSQGHRVIGVGRDFSGWEPPPTNLERVKLNLSDLDDLPHQFDQIVRSHQDLDGLILNAGYGRFGSLEEFSYQQIREMVNTNLLQHIFVTKALIPHMKRLGQGDVIILGSESALSGGKRGSLYCACKFALRGFAQSLRLECSSSGIRVCLINPGMVKSHFFDHLDFEPGPHPEHHLRATDIAEAVSMVLDAHPGTVFEEINLNPLKKVILKKP
jgi:NADP-dependent 3-hydroxy acid dehydrogenase YdfG